VAEWGTSRHGALCCRTLTGRDLRAGRGGTQRKRESNVHPLASTHHLVVRSCRKSPRTATEGARTAYRVVEVTGVSDDAGWGRSIAQVGALVARHGGRYLTRGLVAAVLQGEHRPLWLGVVEGPTLEAICARYDDPAYAPGKALRQERRACQFLAGVGL
jgi:uncharacterized protein (DUF1330 family)